MYRHSRNRIFPFLRMVSMWESLNLRAVSPTPTSTPTRNAHFWFKRKKKKCVCISLYMNNSGTDYLCIYFNSDCTFDFVFGLYQTPKIVGKLLFTLRTVIISEEIQLVWVENNRRKLKYIFLKRWLVNHLLSGNNWEESRTPERNLWKNR